MSARSRSAPWFGTKGERTERLPEIAPAPFIPGWTFAPFAWDPNATWTAVTLEAIRRWGESNKRHQQLSDECMAVPS